MDGTVCPGGTRGCRSGRVCGVDGAATTMSPAGLSCRLVDAGSTPEARAGSGQHRPHTVFRHADDAANLLIRLAFEVIHPNDGSVGGSVHALNFQATANDAVQLSVNAQLRAGVDVISDGEQRRDSYASFVGGILDNCQLIPLTDLLPLVDDPEEFERELRALDVPAGDVRHPAVFGPLGRSKPIAVHELEFVKTLTDCGYEWVLVQEHTVEDPDGGGLQQQHLPRRLVCTNSRGEVASITAVVKTQGSDTKLVAQMQPYYEAKGLSRWDLGTDPLDVLDVLTARGYAGS